MAFVTPIPKNVKQAETVLTNILRQGKASRSPQAIRWWVCKWYMRGVRDFRNLNYSNGTLQVSFVNERGVLSFKLEDIVSKYQAQKGRLMQLDLSPIVTKEGLSLDGMRKASVGQVVLNSIFPKPRIDDIQEEAATNLLNYGTIALIPWSVNEDSIGIEVVPPWELIPIPVEISSTKKIRGLMRRKVLPVEWVKGLPVTKDIRSDVYKEMQTMEVPAGHVPDEAHGPFQGSVMLGASDSTAATTMESLAGGSRRMGGKEDKTRIKVTEVAEIWTMTEDNYWDEYLLMAGGKLMYRTSYAGEKRQFPPQLVADIDVGDFWGRSFVDILIPLNEEMEAALARQFQNVKDWDLFGLVCLPTTAGINTRVIRGKDGIKKIMYEPDPIAPDHKPFNLQMSSTGLLPAKIMELGNQVQNQIANQPTELLGGGAPGRVDSASGLGFLYETSNIPLTPSAKALSQAFAACYRVVLDMTRLSWGNDKVIGITHLDDSIAGVKIDQSSGQITLSDNSIPHPDDVVVNVASAVPRSKEQRKLELKDALAQGLITPTEYNIIARKEGLDLPLGSEVEWQNYRRATLENIILFGDGQEPGQIMFSENDMHPIHLMKLDEFMARPEYFLSSPQVRTKFAQHREEHLAGMGQMPDGSPYAEEAAEEALGMMDMQGMGGMGGMGGGAGEVYPM